MTSFKIKNKYVLGLASWLNDLQLYGKESRERTRFVSVLSERLAETDKFRNSMVEKYVEKGEDGKSKTKVGDDGVEVWDIKAEELPKFEKEYNELMDEDFVLDVLDGNKEKTKVVKDIVLNTDYKFGPKEGDSVQEKMAKIRQAAEYDKWCEAFEAVEL